MIPCRITTHVSDDRTVLLTLPPDLPVGPVDLIVSVDSAPFLRGSVIRSDQPTDPVAEDDWEASR